MHLTVGDRDRRGATSDIFVSRERRAEQAVRLRQNALGARVSRVEERLLEPSANTASFHCPFNRLSIL